MSNTAVEKKPFYKKAWFWVIVVVVCLAVGLAGQSGNESNDAKTDASNTQTSSSAEVELDIEQISNFVNDYNKISESPFTEIKKSGTSGYEAHSFNHEFEMSFVGNQLCVQIQNSGDYSGMLEPFTTTVEALDASASSEAQNAFETAIKSMKEKEDYFTSLGELNVNFSPETETEEGHIQVYKKYQN